MMRMFKQLCGLAVLGLGIQWGQAFSLFGPFQPYQQTIISYQLPGDLGGPMNLGEEYRLNIPTLYYTFDQAFLDFFGSNGVVAVSAAMNVYSALSNVSTYSSDLSEWALESRRMNYRAQALGLVDLKSLTVGILAEQVGLAEPDRYTWTLINRFVGPGGCPADVTYQVIKRNFDPTFTATDVLQPSSYVNGTLYSYFITEYCSGPPNLADANEFPVDPLALTYTAVANIFSRRGEYLTGLTRDDIGGLRYMWRSNNMNIENAGLDTVTYLTNSTALQLLYSSNLTLFAAQALTNDATALAALYPGLLIASSTPYFVNVVSTNPVYYFTNSPFDPYGTPPHLSSNNVVVTNIATWYNHQFVNVVTNQYRIPSPVTRLTTEISAAACGAQAPYGSICFRNTTNNYTTNLLTGGFYIIPANLCSVQIVSTQLITTVYVTNSLSGTTDGTNQFFSQDLVYSWNQYIYAIHPVTCPPDTTALRQGVEKVNFVRHDYDSLLNQFFLPVTNNFTAYTITNNTLYAQTIQRIVTRPDFLIRASNIVATVGSQPINYTFSRTIRFNSAHAIPGTGGPGTLDTGNEIIFNNVGPTYFNYSPNFMTEATASRASGLYLYGTFDGSTNAPIVYPNGTDIINLENQVLIQVNPAGPALPNGRLGVNYTNAFSGFTVTGGSAPYNWAVAPGSPALPWGLTLNQFTGKISGVPLAQGTYDFTVRLTDAGARYVDRPYSMTITP